MYLLEVLSGPLDGKTWAFEREITIGRDDAVAEACLALDRYVSRAARAAPNRFGCDPAHRSAQPQRHAPRRQAGRRRRRAPGRRAVRRRPHDPAGDPRVRSRLCMESAVDGRARARALRRVAASARLRSDDGRAARRTPRAGRACTRRRCVRSAPRSSSIRCSSARTKIWRRIRAISSRRCEEARRRGRRRALRAGASAMYAPDFATFVDVGSARRAPSRAPAPPGHFRGVTTVIAKLLNIVRPDVLFLGQKDAQQAVILRKMIADLDFPVELEIVPTVREPDGLAMSSRNRYLEPPRRSAAPTLYRALCAVREALERGASKSEAVAAGAARLERRRRRRLSRRRRRR